MSIHELLENSIMAQPEYKDKFGIRYVITSFNQHHRETPKDVEYSRIVVGTNTCHRKYGSCHPVFACVRFTVQLLQFCFVPARRRQVACEFYEKL